MAKAFISWSARRRPHAMDIGAQRDAVAGLRRALAVVSVGSQERLQSTDGPHVLRDIRRQAGRIPGGIMGKSLPRDADHVNVEAFGDLAGWRLGVDTVGRDMRNGESLASLPGSRRRSPPDGVSPPAPAGG
jgi:hypothetical protein